MSVAVAGVRVVEFGTKHQHRVFRFVVLGPATCQSWFFVFTASWFGSGFPFSVMSTTVVKDVKAYFAIYSAVSTSMCRLKITFVSRVYTLQRA